MLKKTIAIFPFGVFTESLKEVNAENIEFEPVEGTPDIPEPEEVDDNKILEEQEEFADYMKKKYETPGI